MNHLPSSRVTSAEEKGRLMWKNSNTAGKTIRRFLISERPLCLRSCSGKKYVLKNRVQVRKHPKVNYPLMVKMKLEESSPARAKHARRTVEFAGKLLRIRNSRKQRDSSLCRRRLEVMGARKNGVREGETHVSLARPFFLTPTIFQAPATHANAIDSGLLLGTKLFCVPNHRQTRSSHTRS